MPWPITRSGPSTPMASSHSIGVLPWRRTISWNSTTAWQACVCIGMPRFLASCSASLKKPSRQVSICDGQTIAENRPLGCCRARSMVCIAAVEGLLAGLLVPGIVDGVAVLGEPVALAHHRRHDGADARGGEIVEPAGAADREVGDGGDAALQQLRQRHRGRGAGILGVEAEHRQKFVERTLAQFVAADLLGQALVGRLGEGVAVHIDEAGDGHEARAVDHAVGGSGVARADMQDFAAGEHQVGVARDRRAAARTRPRRRRGRGGGRGWFLRSSFLPFAGKTGMIGS